MSEQALRIGIDVGSTSVKLAVIDDDAHIVYASYQRHHTDVRSTAKALLYLLLLMAVDFNSS